MDNGTRTRRRFLQYSAIAVATAAAGCETTTESPTPAPATGTPADPSTATRTATATATATPTRTPGPAAQGRQKLTASDGDRFDLFGRKSDLWNDRLLVGASGADDPNGHQGGAAYLFERTDQGWSETEKFAAADGATEDEFGFDVAVHDDLVAVGAHGASTVGDAGGAVYVYRETEDGWTRETKLVPTEAVAGLFGYSLALEAETLVVSAPNAPGGEGGGVVCVYEFDGESWRQSRVASPDRLRPENYFGIDVALDGDRFVVGTPVDEDADDENGGAYVYRRGDDGWQFETRLLAAADVSNSFFGISVALDGSRLVVGADIDERIDPDDEYGPGAVYVFDRSDDRWREPDRLVASDGEPPDRLGYDVAVDGDTVVAGAIKQEEPNGDDSGSTYVFTTGGGEWRQSLKVAPFTADTNDFVGATVGVDETTVVAGAPHDEEPNGEKAGSLYAYDLSQLDVL